MKDRKVVLKKIGIVFGILFGIFLIINLAWFFGVRIKYNHLIKNMNEVPVTEDEREKGINLNRYQYNKDGYDYLVKMTAYLSNSGFATVGKEGGLRIEVDENGDVVSSGETYILLNVWPKTFFSGYEYGISFLDAENDYQIFVDENGEYIYDDESDPDEEEEMKKLLESHRQEVGTLLKLADEMWDIR